MESNTFNRLQAIFPTLDNNFEFISSFTILWNIFESQLDTLGYHINYYGFKAFIEKGNLPNFVSTTYIDTWTNMGSYDFLNQHLLFDFRARGVLVDNIEAVLNGLDNDPQNQNFVGLCISYRFRNNLFHGKKNVLDFVGQRDLFNNVNNYLLQIIEYLNQNSTQLIPYS